MTLVAPIPKYTLSTSTTEKNQHRSRLLAKTLNTIPQQAAHLYMGACLWFAYVDKPSVGAKHGFALLGRRQVQTDRPFFALAVGTLRRVVCGAGVATGTKALSHLRATTARGAISAFDTTTFGQQLALGGQTQVSQPARCHTGYSTNGQPKTHPDFQAARFTRLGACQYSFWFGCAVAAKNFG